MYPEINCLSGPLVRLQAVFHGWSSIFLILRAVARSPWSLKPLLLRDRKEPQVFYPLWLGWSSFSAREFYRQRSGSTFALRILMTSTAWDRSSKNQPGIRLRAGSHFTPESMSFFPLLLPLTRITQHRVTILRFLSALTLEDLVSEFADENIRLNYFIYIRTLLHDRTNISIVETALDSDHLRTTIERNFARTRIY